MKAKILFLKRVFVLVTILLSFGLSRISAQDDVNTVSAVLADGSYQKFLLKDISLPIASSGEFNFVIHTNAGKDIDIIGFSFIYDTSATDVKTVTNTDQVSVYPNPSSSNFSLRTNLEVKSIDVFSLTGQIVSTQLTSQSTEDFIINGQNLKVGAYILRLKTNDGAIITKKIIKN
ncbi:MAG TPA: T9SS type A sorting domain-containing protein [Candidatus Paceibacterota bacterium]|jgi:hypothetical protein|nr:T9SS type A sorting domain-containing protein [Candidatus Paceibacterota bacterium]